MSPRFHSAVVLTLAAILVGEVSPASAQGGSASPRSPVGLFGAARESTEPKKLDFLLSVVEGYDEDVPARLGFVDSGSLQTGGLSTIASMSAQYAWTKRRVQLAGNGSASLRHYARLDDTRSAGHAAGFGAAITLTGRTSLLVNQSAAYSPTYLYALFPTGADVEPGTAPPTDPDYAVENLEFYDYTTTVGVSHSFTQRATLSADGTFSYTDRLENTPLWRDVKAHAARFDYSQGMTRNTRLNGYYSYRKGEYGYAGEGETREHRIDVGLSFDRPLSRTRRAILDVRMGISTVGLPFSSVINPEKTRQYLAVGQVGFGYDFGQTWQARTTFRRAIEYIVNIPEPVFADGIGVSIAGLPARRLDLMASAGYASGASALNRDSLTFDTYTGNVRLRIAMNTALATYVEYVYYYYDFRGAAQLVSGLPTGMERNGIRVGLTLWVPVMGR